MKNNLLFYCLGIIVVFLILSYVKTQNSSKKDKNDVTTISTSTHDGAGGHF